MIETDDYGKLLPTKKILEALNALDEAPWADDKNKLTLAKLSRRLRRYPVHCVQSWRGNHRGARGYRLDDFEELYQRWLPLDPPPGTRPGRPKQPVASVAPSAD